MKMRKRNVSHVVSRDLLLLSGDSVLRIYKIEIVVAISNTHFILHTRFYFLFSFFASIFCLFYLIIFMVLNCCFFIVNLFIIEWTIFLLWLFPFLFLLYLELRNSRADFELKTLFPNAEYHQFIGLVVITICKLFVVARQNKGEREFGRHSTKRKA